MKTLEVYLSHGERHKSGSAKLMTVVHEFTVLHPGWECDEKGWVVQTPEGELKFAITSHNGSPYLADEAETRNLIRDYHDYVEDMSKAIRLVKFGARKVEEED